MSITENVADVTAESTLEDLKRDTITDEVLEASGLEPEATVAYLGKVWAAVYRRTRDNGWPSFYAADAAALMTATWARVMVAMGGGLGAPRDRVVYGLSMMAMVDLEEVTRSEWDMVTTGVSKDGTWTTYAIKPETAPGALPWGPRGGEG